MTTPERLRRRQLIEGIIVLLLAIFTTLQALYFSQQDREQRDCLSETVKEITEVQRVRANLNERESEASKLILLNAAALLNPKQPFTTKEQEEAQGKLADAFTNYQKEVAAVKKLREENPTPTYPEGRCDD